MSTLIRWMSEKLDGIRAYWNGFKLLSRKGNELSVPQHFTEGLPATPLDGELWMGRGLFEKLKALLNSKDKRSKEWGSVAYYIFDLPDSPVPYEDRLKELQQLKVPSHVHIAESIQCTSMQHLDSYLQSVVDRGGEGLMVREPRSLYVVGISTTLLKAKASL